MNEDTRTVEPDFRVIAIEETEHWREDIVEITGRIWRLYLVDFNEYTYLCEVTPSVFAWHLYGVSENRIPDEHDDIWADVWSGILLEESDYFRPAYAESKVIHEFENERDYDLSFYDWGSESGYREMIDSILEGYREAVVFGVLNINDGEPVWAT